MDWSIISKFLSRKLGVLILGVVMVAQLPVDNDLKMWGLIAVIVPYIIAQAAQNSIYIWKTGLLVPEEKELTEADKNELKTLLTQVKTAIDNAIKE